MNRLLIQNGRVVDPSEQVDRVTNLLIEGEKIVAIGDGLPTEGAETIDASDRVVIPGLIDLGCQLREPGFEEDETIHAGSAAAIAGGYTTIACLPNTDPPVDSQAGVEFVQHQAARADNCNVLVIGCVSKGREGEQLAELGSLVQAGAVGFSDAPSAISNVELMRRALQYCLMFDTPILSHPEAVKLTRDGIMHEGLVSTVLGLRAMPAEGEDVFTSRDLRLAESTGGRLHIMNVSSAGSIDLIRRAKNRGINNVTVGVNIANLILTDQRLRTFDSNYKVNPPLRSQFHIDACHEALAQGTIGVISSGHVPRAREKKMRELDLSPYGMVGLETALSLAITHLIHTERLSWSQLVKAMSTRPAQVLKLENKGTLRIGADADVTIVDPHVEWLVDASQFRSKASNTPFHGETLTGRAEQVIVGGKLKTHVVCG